VQLRNPSFLGSSFWNTTWRASEQPVPSPAAFWYFLPVALIGLLPWTIFSIAAVAETVRGWKAEGRKIFDGEDTLDVFLLLWLALPIVFFSFSQSKLPGYIVPALPRAHFGRWFCSPEDQFESDGRSGRGAAARPFRQASCHAVFLIPTLCWCTACRGAWERWRRSLEFGRDCGNI